MLVKSSEDLEVKMLGYLDAGSGSMLVGVAAAGAAGVGVALKAGLSKFKRKGKKDPSTPAEEAETSKSSS
ncbi:MAG: hypothetical protein N2037_06585 [Acidimicrobiales bacterium]|nr:hypothetical protein [Acidimicrobiales bacterium]